MTRFVIAKNAEEAQAFHERMGGYAESDARAELVCVLPCALQDAAEREGRHWPSRETLVACEAEFLDKVPEDENGDLHAKVTSGGGAIRIRAASGPRGISVASFFDARWRGHTANRRRLEGLEGTILSPHVPRWGIGLPWHPTPQSQGSW